MSNTSKAILVRDCQPNACNRRIIIYAFCAVNEIALVPTEASLL